MPPAWGRPNRGAKATEDLTLWADGMSLAIQVRRAGGQNNPLQQLDVNNGCDWQADAAVWMAAGRSPRPCCCSSTPQGNRLHGWVACCEVRRAHMSEQHPGWPECPADQPSVLLQPVDRPSASHIPSAALPSQTDRACRLCLPCHADQNHSPAGQ